MDGVGGRYIRLQILCLSYLPRCDPGHVDLSLILNPHAVIQSVTVICCMSKTSFNVLLPVFARTLLIFDF